jgi:Domain of unknown function (DUF5666)
MTRLAITRRQLLLGVALHLFGVDAATAGQWSAPNGDQGIGGSGLSVSGGEEDDRGIGGTGIVGTIQGFGSIIVNDVHIPFDDDTPVRIDGKRVSAKEMKVGHIARVLTENGVAKRIDITSEVLGRIEAIGKAQLSILQQTVDTAELDTGRLKVGDQVAVFGIRAADGTIIARLIERRMGINPGHIRGVPIRRGTTISIGGLVLGAQYRYFAGRQTLVTFRTARDEQVISKVSSESLVPGLEQGTAEVETYGINSNGSLKLGIGMFGPGAQIEFGPDGRTFATVSVRSDRMTSIHNGGRPPHDARPRGGHMRPAGPPSGFHRPEGFSPNERPPGKSPFGARQPKGMERGPGKMPGPPPDRGR